MAPVIKFHVELTPRSVAKLVRCLCSRVPALQFLRGDVPTEEVPSEGEGIEDAESKIDGAEAAKTHIGVDHKDWAWEPSCHEVTALICQSVAAGQGSPSFAASSCSYNHERELESILLHPS